MLHHHLILFEDELWRHFATLVQARPLFALRCGAFTAHERLAAFTGQPVSGLCRSHLMGCFGPEAGPFSLLHDGRPLLLVNARAHDLNWLRDLAVAPINTVYLDGADLLGALISPGLASAVLYFLREQQIVEARDELCRFAQVVELPPADLPRLIRFPWDLITFAGEQIVRDLPLLQAELPQLIAPPPDVQLRGELIYVHPTARLDGPLVLDARDGPICIEANAHIEPFSFIQGPCYIGAGTLVASARIRAETSLGPVCRVGGEIEASTIQGYSNKHHDGFLGHSWLGEWVNIGAMTTNSDLKNTYGSVRIALEGIGQRDSGVLKLGCFLADHVKLGIGLHLNGGTMIGTGSNVFGMHTVPKNIPHFTWGGDVFREYRIDGMISVARTVMGRRKRELTPAYEAVLRAAFALTRSHRGELTDQAQMPSSGVEPALARAEAEAVRA
jgi:UDP-N-acetylglucosamine diphosphorylase/glucosamine-1-phosphate N-acetyltransferase